MSDETAPIIDADIRGHIVSWLAQVAREDDVRILYAAESGSRAWGFASPDSDYDVRFIYAHPRDWYTTLTEARDVIERPLDEKLVDLGGWDVRKAMRLLLKSNPTLYEWFSSPIVYLDDGIFRIAAKQLFAQHASPFALASHYHSIAKGQWRSEINGRDAVKLKKYFYVVRPLLSLQWVIKYGTVPPMNLNELMRKTDIPDEVRQFIDALLEMKRTTPELGRASRIATLDSFALKQIEELQPERHTFAERDQTATTTAADRLFRDVAGL
jgi:uncharacterized protein